MTAQEQVQGRPPRSQRARLVASWLIVGIPLAYALVQTAIQALPLFTP